MLGKNTIYSERISEGRSGSLFFTTWDNRYMVKMISSTEASTMLRILPKYYEHVRDNPSTLIMRIVGFHELNGVPLIVLANVFDTVNEIHEIYDLKGSTHNRSNANGRVKKDLDFQKVCPDRPVYLNIL